MSIFTVECGCTRIEVSQRLAYLKQDLLDQNAKLDTFGIKLYDAVPCCFMLMVDNTMLVEQYIYGTVTRSRPTDKSLLF